MSKKKISRQEKIDLLTVIHLRNLRPFPKIDDKGNIIPIKHAMRGQTILDNYDDLSKQVTLPLWPKVSIDPKQLYIIHFPDIWDVFERLRKAMMDKKLNEVIAQHEAEFALFWKRNTELLKEQGAPPKKETTSEQ